MQLLLIEDDGDGRDMLALTLEAGGYAVTAVGREDAAAALETGAYDLVLVSSWDHVDRVVDLAQPAPVGMLTAADFEPPDVKARGLAFALRKPVTTAELFAQLAQTLRLDALPATAVSRLRDYFRYIELGSYDRLRSLLAPGFTYRLPGPDPRFSTQIASQEAFIDFTQRTFAEFAEPRFDVTNIRPLPRGALVEYVGSWRDGGSRRHVPGVVMFEVSDAGIERAEVRLDVAALG